MTNRQKKEVLLRYRSAEREEERLTQEIARWRSRAEKTTASYGHTTSGAGDGRGLEHTVAQLDDLTRQLTAQRDKLVSLRRSIGDAIDAVQDDKLQELLRLRYIEGLTWERIAAKMGYEDARWIYRLHGKALERLTIVSHD